MNPFRFIADCFFAGEITLDSLPLVAGETKLGAVNVRLEKSKNPFYQTWRNDVNRLVFETNSSLTQFGGFNAETCQALCQVTHLIAIQFLTEIAQHQLGENSKIYWMLQMRDGVKGDDLVAEPRFWMSDVKMLQERLDKIRHLSLEDWYPGIPESATPDFQRFIKALFRMTDARISDLVSMYANLYQGTWLTFAIRNTYGFSTIRKWNNYVFGGFILAACAAVGAFVWEETEFFQTSSIPCVRTLCWLLGILFVLFMLGHSTGLIVYYLCSRITRPRRMKFKINMELANHAKRNWLSSVFGKNPTWCLWRRTALWSYIRGAPLSTPFFRDHDCSPRARTDAPASFDNVPLAEIVASYKWDEGRKSSVR